MRVSWRLLLAAAPMLVAACAFETGDTTDDAEIARKRQGVDPAVVNFLGCNGPTMNGDYIAWWGYDNTSGSVQTIPAGPNNRFTPPLTHPDDANDPLTVFQPGKFRAAFSTHYDGTSQTWTLLGNPWTATPGDRPCAPVPAAITMQGPQTITVSTNASPAVVAAAELLADYLRRMTGFNFTVGQSVRPGVITVGKDGDFISAWRWPYTAEIFTPEQPLADEDYIVWTYKEGTAPRILLAGATERGVELAVWELLYQLGYRQFFPGPLWEALPQLSSLNLPALGIQRRPAFFYRTLPSGTMWSDEADGASQLNAAIGDWRRRNQLTPNVNERGWQLADSAEQRIRADWEFHICGQGQTLPECDLSGLMSSTEKTFCVSRPAIPTRLGLVDAQAVIRQYTNWFLDTHPTEQVVNISPEDAVTVHVGCPTSEPQGAYHMLTLARWAAEEAAPRAKFVGATTNAGQMQPPDDIGPIPQNFLIAVENHPAVQFTVARWKQKGAALVGLHQEDLGGFSNLVGHQSPTGLDKLQRPAFIAEALSAYRQSGATYHRQVDTDAAWGPYGLGMYVAARALMTGNVDVDALRNDFILRMFGSAAGPMGQFYSVMENALYSQDLVARLYAALSAARAATSDPAVLPRIRALAVYVRYLELFRAHDCQGACEGNCTQAKSAFKRLIRFVYATRFTQMLDSAAIYRFLDGSMNAGCTCVPETCDAPCDGGGHPQNRVLTPPCAEVIDPPSCNPWKQPVSPEEVDMDQIITNGVVNNAVFPYTAADTELSADLLPATPPGPPAAMLGAFDQGAVLQRFDAVWYTLPAPDGHVRFSLFPVTDPVLTVDVELRPLGAPGLPPQTLHVVNSTTTQSVDFLSAAPGAQKLGFIPTTRFGLDYAAGTRMVTLAANGNSLIRYFGGTKVLFYVPQNAQKVGIWAFTSWQNNVAQVTRKIWRFHGVRDVPASWAADPVEFSFTCSDNFAIDIPDPGPNQNEYQLWGVAKDSAFHQAQPFVLRNVPQSLARRSSEFLLPRAVVERDNLSP